MSDTRTPDKVEIGPADIQISEGGGVEITNIALSEKLRTALEARKINWPHINLFCPTNFKCGKDAAA